MSAKSPDKKFILFVCCANRDRSVIAERRLAQQLSQDYPGTARKVKVASAGIVPQIFLDHAQKNGMPFPPPYFGKSPNIHTLQYLRSKGIDTSSHCSREIDEDLASEADLILAIDCLMRDEIISRYPRVSGKTFTFKQFIFEDGRYGLDIGDPWAVPEINKETGLFYWPEGYIDSYTNEVELCISSGIEKLINFIKSY